MNDMRLIKIDENTVKYPTVNTDDIEKLLDNAEYKPLGSTIKVRLIAFTICIIMAGVWGMFAVKRDDPIYWILSVVGVIVLWMFFRNIMEGIDYLRAKRLKMIWDEFDPRYRSGRNLIRGLDRINEFLELLEELKSDGIQYELYWSDYDDTVVAMYVNEDGVLCIDACDTLLFEAKYKEDEEDSSTESSSIISVSAGKAQDTYEELKAQLPNIYRAYE